MAAEITVSAASPATNPGWRPQPGRRPIAHRPSASYLGERTISAVTNSSERSGLAAMRGASPMSSRGMSSQATAALTTISENHNSADAMPHQACEDVGPAAWIKTARADQGLRC